MLKTLRKFSLDECDLPTMLWNISIFLRCLTINIDSRCKTGIPVIFYLCTLCSVFIYLYVYFFNVIWFVFVRSPETGDLIAAMVVLSLGVTSEIGVIKLIFMVIYSDEVRRVVDNFLECDSHVIPGTRFSNNMLKILRSVKKRAIFYWVVLIANSVAYNSTPIFMAGRHMSEDLLVIYGLEPMLESPNFEIATVLSTITVSFICFTAANISGFIIILIGYIEAQMLSLTEEMKQVWIDAVADKKKSKDYKHLKNQPFKVVNKFIKLRLVNIINKHMTNISLLNDVEHLFRVPIGIGFVCLSVGIVAQLLGGLQNTYLEVPFAIVQVSVDCYIGQKVMDASILFERAVYDCKWEKFDNSNKKIVLAMLYNSQKTMQVSAAGIVNLDLSFLQSVLNSIYSTYTNLRPMLNKN